MSSEEPSASHNTRRRSSSPPPAKNKKLKLKGRQAHCFGGVNYEGDQKWTRATYNPRDGCIYSFPYWETKILKINPREGTTSLVGGDNINDGAEKYVGAVLAADGCLYGIPHSAARFILKFDPEDQSTSSYVGKDLGTQIHKYSDGVLGADNKIYFMPCAARKILCFDPADESLAELGDDLGSQGYKWSGAVLGDDNCVYGIPDMHSRVLKFDPSTGETSFVGQEYDPNKVAKWIGGVLGADRCIYGVPCERNEILKIDVARQETSLIAIDYKENGSLFANGVLGDDGCLYCMPAYAPDILRYDTLTGECSQVQLPVNNKNGEWLGFNGGVLSPKDGFVYCTPFDAECPMRIKSWDNWKQLRHCIRLRELHQARRARPLSTLDPEVGIVQKLIIDAEDDIFRNVLELLLKKE